MLPDATDLLLGGDTNRARGRNPLLRCGLALAGANVPPEALGFAGPGIYSGEEALNSDLRQAELVVLSACERQSEAMAFRQAQLAMLRRYDT